jgi:hypothetical protein
VNHGRALPIRLGLPSPNEVGGNDIMPIAINICPDFNALASNAFDGKPAAIDRRKDVLDVLLRGPMLAILTRTGTLSTNAVRNEWFRNNQ